MSIGERNIVRNHHCLDQNAIRTRHLGSEVTRDQPYTEVESVKAVSDVFAPLSGEIVAVNEALGEKPETINEDPYGEGWLVKVKLSDPSERDSLMDAAAYETSLS